MDIRFDNRFARKQVDLVLLIAIYVFEQLSGRGWCNSGILTVEKDGNEYAFWQYLALNAVGWKRNFQRGQRG